MKQAELSSFMLIKRLFKEHIKKYLLRVSISTFFMIIAAICSALMVQLIKPAIDEVLVNKNANMLFTIPFWILSISVVKGLAEYIHNYQIKFVGQRVLTDVQIRLYEHLLKSDLDILMKQSTGSLISRFTNDIAMMRGAASNLLLGIAKHFLTVVFLIGLMFKLDFMLSIFAFLVFPTAIYPVIKMGKKMRKISFSTQQELGNYTAHLDETFQSVRVIKSFRGEEQEARRAKGFMESIFNLYKKSARVDALMSPLMESLSGIAVSGVLMYGGYKVIHGQSSPGALMAFITAFMTAYRPFKSLVALNVDMQEGLAATKRLFAMLDTKPRIIDLPHAVDMPEKKDIEFHDVTFKFDNKLVLDGVNFTVNLGKTIALVGASGGGKTTIANLLVRFFEPQSGDITIGDINIKNIKLDSLRDNIALVTQDIMLFDATVAENIAYGMANYDMEEVIKAAKAASAHEFIKKLEYGYETRLGSHGHSLSGGQRQRLSIARAFLKKAPILILDEATSSLDPVSESIVQKALENLRHGRTTIIIAHRLSSVIDADQILVVNDGRIVETGSHEELVKKEGAYYTLYQSQLQDA